MIRTTELRDDDLDGVALFRGRIEGRDAALPERGPAFYRWKYFEAPAGRAVVRLARDGERIVGMVAGAWREAWVRGQAVRVAEIGDLFTDADYRGRGIYKDLLREVMAEVERGGAALAYCRPNDNSFHGLVKHGGFREAFRLRSGLRVLHWRQLIGQRLRFATSLPGLPRRARKGRFSVERIDAFPAEALQAIDADLRRRYDFHTSRRPEYLRWRYLSPANRFEVLRLVDREAPSAFAGYAVLKRGGQRVHLVDFVGDDSHASLVPVIEHARDASPAPAALNLWLAEHESAAGSDFYRGARRRGFLFRRPALHFCVRGGDVPAERWFFRPGDCDGF